MLDGITMVHKQVFPELVKAAPHIVAIIRESSQDVHIGQAHMRPSLLLGGVIIAFLHGLLTDAKQIRTHVDPKN